MYILLATLADFREGIYKDLFYNWSEKCDPCLSPEKQAIEFFWNHTKTIELIFKQGKIIRVYFALHPICLHLSKRIRLDLMTNINRDSTNEKITVYSFILFFIILGSR